MSSLPENDLNSGPPPRKTHFNGPWYLKLLVQNSVAGSIIGRNGSVIASIEQQTGCTLRLSPSNYFFPGTNERIVGVSGAPEEIQHCLSIILEKIKESSVAEATGQPVSKISLKIVAPNSAVSPIIGRQGNQIKTLQETTGAKIQISSREEGIDERTITIAGSQEIVSTSAQAIIKELQADPTLKDHITMSFKQMVYAPASSPPAQPSIGASFLQGSAPPPNGYVSYPGSATPPYSTWNPPAQFYPPANPQPYSSQGQFASSFSNTSVNTQLVSNPDLLLQHCEIHMYMPDSAIGSVIGKNGTSLHEIQRTSGAKVVVSQKGEEVVPGKKDRKITISGAVLAVHAAHVMIFAKFSEAQPYVPENPANPPEQPVEKELNL